MEKRVFPIVAGLLVLLCGLALAQDKDANIVRVYVMAPKPGMTKQFEEGRKRHMDWHRKQNDTWTWETWETLTGPDTGSYLSVTAPPHSWKDFDDWEAKLGTADTADSQTNMGPSITGADNAFWMYMKDWSRPMEGTAHAEDGASQSFSAETGNHPGLSARPQRRLPMPSPNPNGRLTSPGTPCRMEASSRTMCSFFT